MSSRPVRRPSRPRPAKARGRASQLEALETRQLLSTLPVAQPMYRVGPLVTNNAPPYGAYTPAQIRQAYQFNQVSFNGAPGDGSGETIAIVDAYDDPNIQADLDTFDAQFGLPPTTVTRVDENGGSSFPAADSSGGWELEESLDVEWAHAMAPGAKILLVEASSTYDSDLLAGVSYAASHADVVSMSWGGGEFSGQTSYDGTFARSGVAFVASSGDYGAPISWPASSPNVLAVGGTALTLASGNAYSGETGWSGSGGGPSVYESQPAFQSGTVTATATQRANPDVAYDASPSTGFAVYNSYAYNGNSYGWMQIGGTSAGAPQWAAILAIADQGRALSGQPAVDSSSAQEVMTILYQNPGDFHDVNSGTSTGSPNYTAGPGYDYVTGLGSPIVPSVIGSLDGTSTAAPADTIAVTAPTTATAGNSFRYTITADKAGGGVDTGYNGTVSLGSTDGQVAGLPSSYTFTAADAGSHTFTVTLKTAGSQTITETGASGSVASTIAVSPAAASRLVISLSSSATVGTGQSLTVTAMDPYGNVATGDNATVTFSTTDSLASFSPSSAALSGGTRTFTVTFGTAGSQSVTATASGLSTSQSGINVSPPAPTGLTATAASSSQINLTWTAAAGATGYQVQRSTSPTTGWAQVGTTTSTSFSDTSLSAGTTYYYRVIATGGGLNSAVSGTAGATTTGGSTVTSGTDSLWSNSYTPSVNEYSWGSFELGVKFTSTEAGQVTGVRFYKQTWMGGYIHVGHLWSSSGALLAAATFSNETSYGWEQVNFSTSVAIQPGQTYIVSFSTGGGYFGISSGFFNSSGVTSGPLQAPSNSASGGNGVYNYGGQFPGISGGGMNFWVDVAFSPSAISSAQPASTAGSNTPTSPRRGYFVGTTSSATPSGPTGVAATRAPSNATARQPSAGVPPVTYRPAVTQARTPVLWGPKTTRSLG